MDIHTIAMYVIFGLLSIIGYFFKGKLEDMAQALKEINTRIDVHAAEDNTMHIKIVELYVTKAEYQATMDRVFGLLETISQDVKDLAKYKADR